MMSVVEDSIVTEQAMLAEEVPAHLTIPRILSEATLGLYRRRSASGRSECLVPCAELPAWSRLPAKASMHRGTSSDPLEKQNHPIKEDQCAQGSAVL